MDVALRADVTGEFSTILLVITANSISCRRRTFACGLRAIRLTEFATDILK